MITFVFGSNLAGLHNGGAALHAKQWYGATQGNGEGPQGPGVLGTSYAIATKNTFVKPLTLRGIEKRVDEFKQYAQEEYVKWGEINQFLITQIGCGRAGFRPEEISPMFSGCPDNCFLPANWVRFM